MKQSAIRITVIVVTSAVLIFGLAGWRQVSAQPSSQDSQTPDAAGGALPSFVVSIKPNNSGFGGANGTAGLALHISMINIELDQLIEQAYGMRDFQISGWPSWVKTKRYDIDADVDESLFQRLHKLPRSEQGHQRQLMVQSMLADRFKLKVTHATKQFAAYNLVLLRDTSKLKPFAVDPFPGNPDGLVETSLGRCDQIKLIKAKVSALTVGLTAALDALVMDKTGVTGNYGLKLRWTDTSQLSAGVTPDPDFDRTLAEALKDLGLKLEPTTAQRDTITIDHIEEPSPN